MDIISILLASAVPLVLLGGLANRTLITSETERGNIIRGKGIGWQFIRFSVLTTAIPVMGVLTLHGLMDRNAVFTLLAAAVGYAFGKTSELGQ